MKTFTSNFWCALLCVSTAVAAPAQYCQLVDDVVDWLYYFQPQVTSFCSSYLHYGPPPTVTATTTAMPQLTVTLPDSTMTNTITVTSQVTDVTTDTAYAPAPTEIDTVTVNAAAAVRRRNLGGFLSPEISTACSCIVTENTVASTAIVTATHTKTVNVGPLHTVTVPQTVQVTITTQVTVTTDLPATATATATKTVTAAALTATCNVPVTYTVDEDANWIAFGYYQLDDDAATNCAFDCENSYGGCQSWIYDPTPMYPGHSQPQIRCGFYTVSVYEIMPGTSSGLGNDLSCADNYT